jgi:parvulin-like peptidyl-prolyl isomerase
MKDVLKAFYAKPLAIYLAAALLALSTFAGPAEAMFVPAAPHQNMAESAADSAVRAADMAKIQTVFESKILQQKLMDYGLSPEETMARVNTLSDQQIHQLATHTDSLQAGGDGGGTIIGLLIIAILVVVLIYLIQGRIVIK